MEVLWAIFGVLVAIGFFVNLFMGDPSENLAKAQKELSDIEDKIAEEQQEKLDNAFKEAVERFSNKDPEVNRDLRTTPLYSFSYTGTFGEMHDVIAEKGDPLVALACVYPWLEQLSDEIPENSQRLYEDFLFKFFKTELAEEDFENNFLLTGIGSPDNEEERIKNWSSDLMSFLAIRKRIFESSSEHTTTVDDRANFCSSFISQLVEKIDDDDLKLRFINLARESLTSSGMFTFNTESALAALEL